MLNHISKFHNGGGKVKHVIYVNNKNVYIYKYNKK